MKYNLLWVVGIVLATCSCINKQEVLPEEESVYMFSYFNGNGDGLHLAYSVDGLQWTALHNDSVLLIPELGKDKLMRDPSIVRDENGTFHMVWTTGWWDQGFGYAHSQDLINWSEQLYVPAMAGYEGTKNTWAPELFYNTQDSTYYIFWSSTVPGAFPELPVAENEKGLNHRQYYLTTRDFKTFSETKLFFEPGFSVIDGAIYVQDDVYYLFVKNENSLPAEKNIRVTSNNKPYDFPTTVSEPITGDYWAEGAAPLRVGEYVYVYFDKYMEGKYGAVRSKDMQQWEDVSDSVSFPRGMRHGTAFEVKRSILDALLQE